MSALASKGSSGSIDREQNKIITAAAYGTASQNGCYLCFPFSAAAVVDLEP